MQNLQKLWILLLFFPVLLYLNKICSYLKKINTTFIEAALFRLVRKKKDFFNNRRNVLDPYGVQSTFSKSYLKCASSPTEYCTIFSTQATYLNIHRREITVAFLLWELPSLELLNTQLHARTKEHVIVLPRINWCCEINISKKIMKPDSFLPLGIYSCFVQRNFVRVLPHLLKGVLLYQQFKSKCFLMFMSHESHLYLSQVQGPWVHA